MVFGGFNNSDAGLASGAYTYSVTIRAVGNNRSITVAASSQLTIEEVKR